jgi:hypothetical protein
MTASSSAFSSCSSGKPWSVPDCCLLRLVLSFVAILGGIALVILEKQHANGSR